MILFLDLSQESWGGICVPDRCFIARVDCGLLDVQLGAVEGNARNGGTICCMYCLMIYSLVIGIAVQLRVKREVVVVDFIVLVAFHVKEDDVAGGLVDGTDNHVDNVPVGIECAVWEAGFERPGCMYAFEERGIVAAEL